MARVNLQKTTIGSSQEAQHEKMLIDQEDVRREIRQKIIGGKRQEDLAAPASSLYNMHTTRKHLFNEIHSSFENYKVIMEAFFSGRAFDLSDVPRVRNEPIIIIGSGPSLDDAWPELKRWKGDIITSTSQYSTFIYHGIEPKYILALDPDCNMEELAADTWEGRKTILITHPGVNSDMLNEHTFKSINEKFARRENSDYWKGRLALFRKLEPQTPFYGNTQKFGYSRYDHRLANPGKKAEGACLNITPLIKTEIPMMGCAINCQVMAAGILGYNPIYLVGCDFGYTNDQHRYNDWNYVKEREEGTGKIIKEGWVKTDFKAIPKWTDKFSKLQMSDSGIQSSEMMFFYKRNFMNTWRLEQTQIIRTTPGILIELPFCPLKTVVDQDGVLGGDLKGITKNDMINRAEEYLSRQNTYLIHFAGLGVQFTEFTDGVTGVMQYLHEGIKRGINNLDFNKTISEIQRLADYSHYMTAEDKKIVKSWQPISPEEAKQIRESAMAPPIGLLEKAIEKKVEKEDIETIEKKVKKAKLPHERREKAVLEPKEKRNAD